MWRETSEISERVKLTLISIHSLRVEGDKMADWQGDPIKISIHSLRVEGDQKKRETTWRSSISIHSLRVEGDVGDQ